MKILRSILCTGLALGAAHAEDMVLRWNHVLHTTIRTDNTSPGPTWGSRNPAMMHIAVFEAVNSINRNYAPFYEYVSAAPGASAEAAAAQAAYRVLESLYPAQSVVLRVNLADSLSNIASAARDAGVAVGNAAAELVLAQRANDGSDNNAPYSPSADPGRWRPDPLHPGQTALGPNWGSVRPFTLANGAQFRPPAPPALSSAEYAFSYSEVFRLGALNSTERTIDQTEIGIFWGYDRGGLGPPPILYDQVAELISRQRNFSLDDNARLFAMLTTAMADAGIACWEAKYFYDFWRPVGGIRGGEADGNSATIGDPNWAPLGAPGGGPPRDFTPPFPAYPSGHATFGAAIFRILELVCGTDTVSFTLGSDEMPGVQRSFASFSQAAEENGRSRIYLGIHWNFDDTEGRALGRRVADHVFQNRFAPILRTTHNGSEMRILWPASVKSYQLKGSADVMAQHWFPLAGAPAIDGAMQYLTVPMSGTVFFKLERPMP